ncbi:MAG: hypothetical protein PHD01_17255 [Geobacteraceae bacterium]|nr:hypothetical protein [Geobacteraceae bacterium]
MEAKTNNATDRYRRPAWMRVLDILLRTGHVGFAGILLGGFIFEVPNDLHLWHYLTIFTGLGLLLLELRHSLGWPHQVRGLVGIVHIGLPGLVHLFPAMVIPFTWMTLATGGIVSHMPRKLRYWSILNGRVVD